MDLPAQIQELEERLLDPDFRKNPQQVASLLTDDFYEFGSSGRRFSLPEILDLLLQEPPVRVTLSDFRTVRLADTVVLATYRSHREATGDEPVECLRSSLWVLRNGQWQMRFHQGTRTEVR